MDAFRAFDPALKWRLPSGKTVEDVLYNAYMSGPLPGPVEALLYHWAVDVHVSRSCFPRRIERDDPSVRSRIGTRLDCAFRASFDARAEIGALEAARNLRGRKAATKWLTDKSKVGQVLCDMARNVANEVGHDAAIMSRVQLLGVSVAGPMVQFSRLCYGKGHICLLIPDPELSVPLAVNNISQLTS